MERKTSCYNDESHTSSRTDTLVRGANRDKLQLVTTGIRERHKSGKEHTYTTKDDNTTQSTDQFQTSAQDEFCFANEVRKNILIHIYFDDERCFKTERKLWFY